MIKKQLEKLQQCLEKAMEDVFKSMGTDANDLSFFGGDLPEGELPEDWEEREEWKQ